MTPSRKRQRLTAAPGPLVLADGTEYQVSPLNDKDIAELDMWVQSRYVQLVMNTCPPDYTDEQKNAMRCEAAKNAMDLSWMHGAGARIMATIPGMTQLLLVGIRKRHPTVTFEELAAKLYDPRNIDLVQENFADLNLGDPEVKKGPRVKQKPR